MTTPPPGHHPDLRLGEVERAAARSRADGPWSVEHLTICWIVLVVVGVVLATIAGLASGGAALAGAALGIGIVGAFFTVSTWVIARVGARHPHSVLAVALATYVVKIVALGAVVVLLPRNGPVSPRWMAAAVVVGLIGWMAAHLRYVWTAKVFYVDPH